MWLLANLIAAFGGGYGISTTRPALWRVFRGDWYTPVTYTAGTLTVGLFGIWSFLALGGRRDQIRFVLGGWLLSALGVGLGVMLDRARLSDQSIQENTWR